MFIIIIILLSATHHVQMTKFIDIKEIEILWDTMRGDSDYVNQDNFCSYYKDEDSDELLNEIKTYCHKYSSESQSVDEYRMGFNDFTKAASEGCIQRCSKQAMYTLFKNIIPNEEDREYIIDKEMIKYYASIFFSPRQLRNIVKKYGKLQDGKYILDFNSFKKIINIGHLPKPFRDEIAIEKEIVHIFNKITCNNNDFITYRDMKLYYHGHNKEELSTIIHTYGTEYTIKDEIVGEHREYRMKIDDFKIAGTNGCIPRFSKKVISTEFNKMIPKEDGYISYKNMRKYYRKKIPKSQLGNIIEKYGELQDGQYRLNEYGFTKAMYNSDLPEPLCDKITTMHTTFKKIILEKQNRNHIILDDMITYYGEKKDEFTLKKILRKHGKWHNEQFVLHFPHFKSAINFSDLPVPQ